MGRAEDEGDDEDMDRPRKVVLRRFEGGADGRGGGALGLRSAATNGATATATGSSAGRRAEAPKKGLGLGMIRSWISQSGPAGVREERRLARPRASPAAKAAAAAAAPPAPAARSAAAVPMMARVAAAAGLLRQRLPEEASQQPAKVPRRTPMGIGRALGQAARAAGLAGAPAEAPRLNAPRSSSAEKRLRAAKPRPARALPAAQRLRSGLAPQSSARETARGHSAAAAALPQSGRQAAPRAAINALKLGTEAQRERARHLRSASPCSTEAPLPPARRDAATARKAVVQRPPARGRGRLPLSPGPGPAAKVGGEKRPRAASPSTERQPSSPAEDEESEDEASRSSSPVEVVAERAKRQRVASPPSKPSKPALTPAAAVAPNPFEATVADEPNFQELVLDRLQKLCGEHEDAKVLAEYIVVMVAGSKSREEMAIELRPFFQDQAQAESFVDWVEDCKWKFLTAGQHSPPPRPGGVASPKKPGGAAGRVTIFDSPRSPERRRSEKAPVTVVTAGFGYGGSRSQAARGHNPHVAVTSKAVLQPSPHFVQGQPQGQKVSSPPPPPARVSSVTGAVYKALPLPRGGSQATVSGGALPASAASKPVRRDKNELLESMTKQLQLILTKLNDKGLNDETREKYQMLAQNVQMQMAKISKPQAPQRRR